MATDVDNDRHGTRTRHHPRATVASLTTGSEATGESLTAGGERVKFVARSGERMPRESSDPRSIDVLVVHADDVVAALAATAQGRDTVLRVTPPFRGRQRARIHVVVGVDGAEESATASETSRIGADELSEPRDTLHVPADAFVSADAPSFPRAPDTEPTPAASPEYDVDEHFERHEDAVADWRETVTEYFRERTRVDGPGGETCEFEVRYLGGGKG
jgi:hypothetical protein